MLRRQKEGKKQLVWSYMRRTKIFCTKDLLTIFEIDLSYLKTFLYHLEKAGYIATEDKDKNIKYRCYRLLEDTGPIAPKTVKGELYDYNINKSILFTGRLERVLNNLLVGIEAEEFLLDYLKDPLQLLDIKSQIRAVKKINRFELLEKIAQKITKDTKWKKRF